MRYHAIAADYDGTLAHGGVIDAATSAALARLRASRRRLVLVTGRELDELLGLLATPERFDRIVAENGAVLYAPATRAVRCLAMPPPPPFADELRRRGLAPLAIGRVVVATRESCREIVTATIRDLGLDLQVIGNRGAVMVLPAGVDKATGLAAALAELRSSPRDVVAIGDAENDVALLDAVGLGVAVPDAVPALQARADLVMGVVELVDRLIAGDDLTPRRRPAP
jgi:hydroxymethylpyrimidine pyrophosphatase-like HAD family hydrolase